VRRNRRQGVGDASLFLQVRVAWQLGWIMDLPVLVVAAADRMDRRSQSSLSRVV
jgi:hypothetical protein